MASHRGVFHPQILPKTPLSKECADVTEWEDCPAGAWGLDLGQCEEDAEGVPLDVGCDDPLPHKLTDPDGFEYFACCCQHSVFPE
jgi:hypothetical protein